MKILLLGPNGQLGTDIALAAEAAGVAVEPCSRSMLEVEQGAAIVRVLEASDADIVLNTTSYHKTDEVEDNAQKAIAVNAHAVGRLAEACRDLGKRFVTISTDFVFGAGHNVTPLTETDAPGPINVYGSSKLMGESLAIYHNPDCLIFRVASLFGVKGPSGKGANFIEVMLKMAKERDHLRVVRDQIMSPTYTADAAQAIIGSLVLKAPAGVYHCVGSGQASWFDLAREAIDLAGIDAAILPIRSSEFPTRAARPGYTVLNNSKLAAIVGPIPDWRDAVKRYLIAKGHLNEGA